MYAGAYSGPAYELRPTKHVWQYPNPYHSHAVDEYPNDRFYSRENQQNQQNQNAFMRMNSSSQGVVSQRRIQSAPFYSNHPEPPQPNPQLVAESREEMLYHLAEDSGHWQFPKIIVGYQPMRPYDPETHGLMLKPTMIYQADNMVYQLRNEDFTKPTSSQISTDVQINDGHRDVACGIGDNSKSPKLEQSSKLISSKKSDKESAKETKAEERPSVGAPQEFVHSDKQCEDEATDARVKVLVVKTVASQTNITLQSPDSLSVKKSYDNNSAKVVLNEDASPQSSAKSTSETVI